MSQVKGKVNNFLDISVICRLCGENSVKKKYVFLKNNQELLDKIFSVLGLEVKSNKNLNLNSPLIIVSCFLDIIPLHNIYATKAYM